MVYHPNGFLLILMTLSCFDDHLKDLEAVFKLLREAGISLKLNKCVFAASEVEYLGFVLSTNGTRPQSQLTEAIKTFANPTTKKEVKCFLGMAGFYRECKKEFAHIAIPLNNLTKDNVVFEWSTECNQSFKTLKEALLSAPVLVFPQTDEEFLLEVGASKYAVGVVLSQKQSDSSIHPIAYFSTSLTKTQQNWSPYSQEAYALVMAVRHWDTYLTGNHFVVNSDHNPLVYLQKKKNPKGKIARWICELEGYDLTMKMLGEFRM